MRKRKEILLLISIVLGVPVWPSWCSKTVRKEYNTTQNVFYACGETFLTIFWNNVHELTLTFSTLVHPFGNKPKPSIPAALWHVPSLPPPLSLISLRKKKPSKKKWKTAEIETNAELIQFYFLVPWNYLCGYASTLHTSTQTHTHTHGCISWINHTLQLVGKIECILKSKVDVFWYSMNT